jgi:pSer/pThr/pTyr-binding forkhead associated (FHA) protein
VAASQFILRKADNSWQREIVGPTKVGRGELAGIALSGDDGASRQHAELSIENGDVVLRDLGSKNGTYVNDKRIVQPQTLRTGDRVRFHTQAFLFEEMKDQGATIIDGPREIAVMDADAAAKRGDNWLVAVKFDEGDATQACSREQQESLTQIAANYRAAVSHFEPVRQPTLTQRRDPAGAWGTSFILPVDAGVEQTWYVGRKQGCDLRIDDPSVSGVHAKIQRIGSQWYVIDAISKNGLFVNGIQAGKQYLSSGDIIKFGNIEFALRLPGKSEPSSKKKTGWGKYALIVVVVAAVLVAALWLLRKFVM